MFMSKKKSKLPARPQPPSWEEMEEDLRVATKKDIIFTLTGTAEAIEKEEIPEQMREDSENGEDLSERDLFKQAVSFVEKNDELMQNMRFLDEAREKLEEVSSNLEKTVDNVKQQALVAIDGY